ncbi:11261_t:CDS:10 [Ambispora gerdemannii]|uniref:11261_t:CDS:1 n=1 Tax=Ambispora gerdemannii TaxID=144530 RepID=A0A9N8UWN4_9GLOM|nr:11261_t:CDS:10 [Ambispora gerdemannii]
MSDIIQVESVQQSIFHELTRESGLELGTQGQLNKLVVEPSVFLYGIIQKLKNHSQYPNPLIEQFLESLQAHIEDNAQFQACLQPSIISGSAKFVTTNNSIIQVLLSIDFLQPRLIDILLEKLPGFITDSDNETVCSPIPRLIIHQLKWLGYIVEPDRLSSKILEVISITPINIQREIIINLPEIVDDDSQHNVIIDELKTLMEENYQLTVPILDALSNFIMHGNSINELRDVIIERLESADLADLPIVLKFLLQFVTPDDVEDVIQSIRKKLDFRSIGKLQEMNKQSKSFGKSKKENMPETLIFESIKTGIQFHKFVKDAWLKIITELNSPTEHEILDILVLFIVHSFRSMKKKVEPIFRKKVSSGLITHQILEETITCHSEGLFEYFKSIISLSEALLRSTQQHSQISRAASIIYKSCFKVFELEHQQEIVWSLVTHIGSGLPAEVDSALAVLLALVKEDSKKLYYFAVYFKGILDFLDNLSFDQIRVLFEIISRLAIEEVIEDTTSGTASGGGLLSEFSIVIQKRLAYPSEKDKQIGVIGALTLVRTMGSKEECQKFDPSSSLGSDEGRTHPLLNSALENLQKLQSNIVESKRCYSLIYDELAYLISHRSLDSRIESWIKDKMASRFTDIYVIDIDETNDLYKKKSSLQNLPIEIWMHDKDGTFIESIPIETWIESEKTTNESVLINIYPMLCAPHVNANQQFVADQSEWIMCISSMFKLMQACEKADKDSLDDIDALLGSGIVMYKKNEDHSEQTNNANVTQDVICDSLFIAINWFREIINSFSEDHSDIDFHKTVIARLQHVEKLEKKLEEELANSSLFHPIGYSSLTRKIGVERRNIVIERSKPATQASNNTKQQQPRTRRRPAIIGKRKALSSRQHADEGEKSKSSGDSTSKTTLADLRPLMREFEWHVFYLFKYADLNIFEQDSGNMNLDDDNQNKNCSQNPKLGISQMVYLLKDLDRKLEYKLSSSTISNLPFFAKKSKKLDNDTGLSLISRQSESEVVDHVIKTLPLILKQFEVISEGDMVMSEQSEIDEINQCMELILGIIYRVFSWSGLMSPDKKETVIRLLTHFHPYKTDSGSRNTSQTLSIQQAATKAFTYLEIFADSLSTGKLAIYYHKILYKITEMASDPKEFITTISTLAKKFASHEWKDTKQLNSSSITYLIENDIKHSDDNLERIDYYVSKIFPALETDDEQTLKEIPLLNTANFPDFYKVVSMELIGLMNDKLWDFESTEMKLEYLAKIVKCWRQLITVIKYNQKRAILAIALKYGRNFVDLFSKNAIPFIDLHLKGHRKEIQIIFKYFQVATRHLQALCIHVKVVKEVKLSNMVPLVKKSLESVIFRVKGILQHNDFAAESFFLGNLRQRDLEGHEVNTDRLVEPELHNDEDKSESELDEQYIAEIEDEIKGEENSDVESSVNQSTASSSSKNTRSSISRSIQNSDDEMKSNDDDHGESDENSDISDSANDNEADENSQKKRRKSSRVPVYAKRPRKDSSNQPAKRKRES